MLVSAAGLVLRSRVGDYPVDAGPAIAAIVGGGLRRALDLQPLMGSLSVIVRAPFAVAADQLGAGEPGVYRAGVIPCVAATALLGVAIARARGSNLGSGPDELHLLVPVLAILTPASLAAVRTGHPEEL